MTLSIDAIDWSRWRPTDRATLLFVIQGDQILLIRKKRGLGAGKINAPGGRIQPGESPVDAAIREVQEELVVTPHAPSLGGYLSFQFVDGYSIYVHVFTSRSCTGRATETDEAVPLWTSTDQIPFHDMWADDRIWVPLLLEGIPFDGRFIFDGDRMLDHRIETGTPVR
jgi:8-oxo-dGTP diphosphatase